MKKYLVVGNPINHSLSPMLHNYWIRQCNIKADYSKKKINENEIEKLILQLKEEEIHGINVTIPFKGKFVKYLDELSDESQKTNSVNTIYKKDGKIYGHNTDIGGFNLAIRHINYNLENKKILVLGAGGVVPSIIFSLINSRVSKLMISNRTKEKVVELKKKFNEIEIIDWGDIREFDMIINATSLGLNMEDNISIDFEKIRGKKLFYDVIYNPQRTNFLINAKKNNHMAENGKMMFIYQAHQAFAIWHNKLPKIDENTLKLFQI